MDGERRLRAQLAPPPDGPQARARGEVHATDSDGGITVEVTVRQLAVPQDACVTLVCGDREVASFPVAGGSGSHARTLEAEVADVIEDGTEVTLHHVEGETVERGQVLAVSDQDSPLMHGVLRETEDAPA